jgi:hypothetical protein
MPNHSTRIQPLAVSALQRLLTVTNGSFWVPQIHTGQFMYCPAVHFHLP